MSRILSFTEISTALSCQARWDFKYGGHLAGSALREKTVTPLLSGGRAWGAAVATWHANVDKLTSGELAIEAMDASLEADAEKMREHGVFDEEEHARLRTELLGMLVHYVETAEPVLMDEVLEQELLVPIPSRTGVRSSSRYKLQCFLDATETVDGAVWINEFKLRTSLTPVSVIVNSRQIRWYAWAYQQQFGVPVAGVWVNERLREVPKPARVLKSGKPSHAKDQMTTVASYEAVCREAGEEPKQEVLEALRSRKWQQRVPVMFRESELEEAGRELVAAAKLISQLDSGDLMPLRNVHRGNCVSCPFRDVCPSPDGELVEALFERRPPKRELHARAESEPSQNSNPGWSSF